MGWTSDWLASKQAEGFGILGCPPPGDVKFSWHPSLNCGSRGCDLKRSSVIDSPLCWPHTVAYIASLGIPQASVEATLHALADLMNAARRSP